MVFWNMSRLEGILSNFFVSSSIDLYKVRQRKKHQYLSSYQSCYRSTVYLELAVSASFVISHLRAPSVLIRLLCMVGRQNRAGWCWTVGSRRNDAMSATYCLPFPAQHHFHKTDCTLISVYLPFFISSSLPSCKVISCICQSCCVDFQSYNMNVSQLLHGFEKLLHGFFKVVYFALC